MKITAINIDNFQGLRNAALSFSTPIALIAGANGMGKSSLIDAVRFALLGEHGRVSLKKDLGQLMTEGAAVGAISVQADGQTYSVALPMGKGVHVSDSSYLPYVLTPQLFARLDADSRRRLLYSLTGCTPSRELVSERLQQRGVPADKIEEIMPVLRSGFDVAQKHAETKKTECRGAWKAVTGETYGEKKAEGWKAPIPAADPGVGTVVMQEDLANLDAEIGAQQQSIGALKARQQHAQSFVSKLQALRDQAAKYARIAEKLNHDEKELATWQKRVDEYQQDVSSTRIGLVHQLAYSLRDLIDEQQPLGIERPQYKNAVASLETYEAEHGVLPPADAIPCTDPHIKSLLASAIQSRDLFQRSVENDKRDLAGAEAAAQQIKAAEEESASNPPPSDADIQAAQQRLTTLQASRKVMADQIEAQSASARAAAVAVEKTNKAAGHHADFLIWSRISDALAPDGIQNELLQEALAPVNKRMAGLSQLAGWGTVAPVALRADMELTYNGRVYGLLSESEQWRVDCISALLIAELAQLRLIVLDRFDVLDLEGRADLFALLDELAAAAVLDTAIVCGTLKAAPSPAQVSPTVTPFWIAGGVVTAVGARETVAA